MIQVAIDPEIPEYGCYICPECVRGVTVFKRVVGQTAQTLPLGMVTQPATPAVPAPVVREFMLADNAHERAYDEMLERRGCYIELYGLDMDADQRNGNDNMFDLLNAIDNNDTEFWDHHNTVVQRWENARAAVMQYGIGQDEVLTLYSSRYGSQFSKYDIDWDRYQHDGLFDDQWFG